MSCHLRGVGRCGAPKVLGHAGVTASISPADGSDVRVSAGDRRLQRQRPPGPGPADLRPRSGCRSRPPDRSLQQRLPAGPAPGELPPARRLHRPAARAAHAGAPDGAAADARRRPRRVGGPDHGRHPALRLRPIGQEGRLADLDRRAAGRRPADHGRGDAGDHDDAARAAGARLLRHPRRPPHRDRRARRALPRDATSTTPWSCRPTSATPRRRPSSPGCSASPSRPAASSASPTTGSSSTPSSATWPGGGRSCSTTRSPPAARWSSCSTSSTDEGLPDVAIACTHGLFTGKAVERLQHHPSIREVVTTDTVPPPLDDWPDLRVRSVARLFAEAIRRSHDGESVSSLFDGVDPAYAPPQGRLDLDVSAALAPPESRSGRWRLGDLRGGRPECRSPLFRPVARPRGREG